LGVSLRGRIPNPGPDTGLEALKRVSNKEERLWKEFPVGAPNARILSVCGGFESKASMKVMAKPFCICSTGSQEVSV